MKQNLQEIKCCPVCGHEQFSSFKTVKDHSTSQEVFSVVSCNNCDFLFTNPRPADEHIGRYYESDKYISHTNQRSGLFATMYQVFRSRALKTKLSWINRHMNGVGRLLDYGSGTGEFLNFCKVKGWNVQGLEIAEAPRTSSIRNYKLDVRPPAELRALESNAFDVISMWHVLEHVSNMKELLGTLLSKLKQNGLLVLALPNPESFDAEYYGEYWAAWDVPIHFYHFKKRDISALASQLNLELLETINMPFDSYYVSLLSEEYKSGRKNWLKASWIGLKSNVKGKYEKNASSLTYILRKR